MATALFAGAQDPAPAPAAAQAPAAPATAPAPLSTFGSHGSAAMAPPATFDAGPFGKLSVNASSPVSRSSRQFRAGNDKAQVHLSNGQFHSKADGKYSVLRPGLGAYTMPTLSVPLLTPKISEQFLWACPVAFLKLPVGKTTSFEIGSLPTLMGAESTFTYQNSTSNAASFGTRKRHQPRHPGESSAGQIPLRFVSWNDGYYSNRYSFLSGSLTYKRPTPWCTTGWGTSGRPSFKRQLPRSRTRLYACGDLYVLQGAWIVSPYFQYGKLPTNSKVGVTKSTSATGGAINVSYAFKRGFSLPVRFEYLTSSGSATGWIGQYVGL